jgi:hypothetical protein
MLPRKKGAHFLGFQELTGQPIVQNDYLSSASNFRSIEYHHTLYLNFETLAGLWPCDIETSLKIEILGFFHHHHEISDP